uniref:Dihydrolipoamide acetyltransferase component of pyruvate dehydrogenase complex n=1 Tax=Octactis speculum TaxID=3111310 RepID=A0A7S2DNK3_9STRA
MVVESDKADMDVESFESGYIAQIIIPEGESASVGDTVAVIVSSEADIAKVGDSATPPESETCVVTSAATTVAVADSSSAGLEVTMPALSSTMVEGKIVQWLKGIGEKVEIGDAIMVVESDKADMDVESFEEGYLAAILTPEGGSAAVGDCVAVLAETEAEIAAVASAGAPSSAAPAAPAPAAPAAAAPAAAAPAPAAPAAVVVPEGERVVASGYAKKVASAAGVDLRTVRGSGPNSRIVADDVLLTASGMPPAAHTPAPGVVAATPMARTLSKAKGVDLSTVAGTGNFGRVTEDDVLAALGMPRKNAPPAPAPAAAGPAAAGPAASSAAPKPPPAAAAPVPEGLVPMDGMQKAVVKNMEATLGVPIFRVSRSIATDSFDALYAKLKPKGVTVSALLAKACAMVLEKHPIVNAAYDPSGAIKYNEDINVAMAVALDGGLITPTIRKCNTMDIYSVGREWKDLVTKAKEKRLAPIEYNSGTFTISNLGMFGVSSFEAILPPGTGSILAIAGSAPTVVAQANGHLGVVKKMTVTITCDHRHIYGADAAMFLKDLADLLENNTEDLLY